MLKKTCAFDVMWTVGVGNQVEKLKAHRQGYEKKLEYWGKSEKIAAIDEEDL